MIVLVTSYHNGLGAFRYKDHLPEYSDSRDKKCYKDITGISILVKRNLFYCNGPGASIHQAIRRFAAKSREVSKTGDCMLELSHRSKIWQESGQPCCRGACQIWERLEGLRSNVAALSLHEILRLDVRLLWKEAQSMCCNIGRPSEAEILLGVAGSVTERRRHITTSLLIG